MTVRRPRGLLFDYGGTLVEEVAFDPLAGVDFLLRYAESQPTAGTLAMLLERAERVTREVGNRRDEFHIETPWASLTRLIHYPCGIRFTRPLAELELGFWDASVSTRAMPGVAGALAEFQRAGIPMGLVSNTSFGAAVLLHELAKHGLADYLSFNVTSAEYAVRKPNTLLFEAAAAQLGVAPEHIWFVGDRLDTDISGAQAAGMHPIHFAPAGTGRSGSLAWPEIAALFRGAVD